jgi:hypothetical protein
MSHGDISHTNKTRDGATEGNFGCRQRVGRAFLLTTTGPAVLRHPQEFYPFVKEDVSHA